MKNYLYIFFLVSIPLSNLSQKKQKPFVGMLEYKITIMDTSLQKLNEYRPMKIYTNDTLLRIENYSEQLGPQVFIKHLILNKSYLLIQTPMGNFAIRTDHNKIKDTIKPKYTLKKKCFGKKILGKRAKKMEVSHPDFKEPMELLYYKDIKNKYVTVYPNSPGLPVKYYISSYDGILKYELIQMKTYTPHKDLFGIPSDYQKVSFDEFMNIIKPENKQN